jgi:hypothetical protein
MREGAVGHLAEAAVSPDAPETTPRQQARRPMWRDQDEGDAMPAGMSQL